MNEAAIATIEDCVASTLLGRLPFPEVVRRLREVGVERYQVDLSRGEYLYYSPSGDAHAVQAHQHVEPIAEAFAASAVEAAVRDSQQGRIVYPEFLQRIRAAGCVGYLVSFAGRRCVYWGRTGEAHVEFFPGAA